MWEKGVLGCKTPETLVKTLIYLFGINFALLAAQDHQNLRWGPYPQIELLSDTSRCIVSLYKLYVEHVPEQCPRNAFYLRPLDKPFGKVLYSCQAIGKIDLQS
jgi:hypothetical protein